MVAAGWGIGWEREGHTFPIPVPLSPIPQFGAALHDCALDRRRVQTVGHGCTPALELGSPDRRESPAVLQSDPRRGAVRRHFEREVARGEECVPAIAYGAEGRARGDVNRLV